MELTGLPLEILEEIIITLDPVDVAHISECCNLLRQVVYNPKDRALWRRLYLQQPLDDPRECVSMDGISGVTIDWKGLLQRFIRLRTVLYDPSRCRARERLTILESLLEVISNVRPHPTMSNFECTSRSLAWVAATLSKNMFLDEAESCVSDGEIPLLAQLHTYYGVTVKDTRQSTRVRSRAFVYDMRNYQPENQYGPLDSQGRVNWIHIQAIHHVTSMHLVDLHDDEDFKYTTFPMSIPFTQIVIPSGMDLDHEDDWAGVEGQWRVSFCFCDHRDLLSYNESRIDTNGELDASIFEQPGFGEVFRSMAVKLRVLKTTPDQDHPNRPAIHFFGEMLNSSSTMNGVVRMTPDNQGCHLALNIPNQISGDHGDAVWSSVGIHIGGIRAPFGVLGSWTTVSHDWDDPVGPFWLTKHGITRRQSFSHVSTNAGYQALDSEPPPVQDL